MNFRENISLKKHTTMRVGGPARYFFETKNISDINEAVIFARTNNLPIFTLGGGTNTIFSDEGFSGVVIAVKNKGVIIENKNNKQVRVIVEAGEDLDVVVEKTVLKNLYGLENLSLIPGTIGGCVVQNSGAYGKEVSEFVEWVKVLNTNTMQTQVLLGDECEFGYRNSIFKKEAGKNLIVLSVSFLLKTESNLFLEYGDIKKLMNKNNIKNPEIRDARDIIIEIRRDKFLDIEKFGTAGSFFKNPVVSKEYAKELKVRYADMPEYYKGEKFVMLSAGYLIDNIGFKGVIDGSVGTYCKHALILLNLKNATTKELFLFSEKIKKEVKNKTGIVLEEEVVFVKNK